MPGSLRRVLQALTALALLTAVAAGLFVLSLRAGRVEPAVQVEITGGAPPALVVLEPADEAGGDPFTAPVAVALGVPPALLPLPADDPASLESVHRRHSAADRAAAGPFGLELAQRRERGQQLTVQVVGSVARRALGAEAEVVGLEDGDGDGDDDDGRFTLVAGDGSAVCVSLGAARGPAAALGLQHDPADGAPVSGITWDPAGPCDAAASPPPAGPPDGSTPGIYAGAEAGEVCDVPLLVDLLLSDPAVAEAWALVRGIAPGTLAEYAAGLTPVVLLRDTLVTDHGYAAGKALSRRAVLQRGTAVLIDARGEPVARCVSGSPLLPARSLAADVEIAGTPWAAFRLEKVAETASAERPVAEFLLVDLTSGLPLRRLPGLPGAAPGLAGPVMAGEP